jgi:hypothetical protein
LGSRMIGVGDRARLELSGESRGVDKGDEVGELLCEVILSSVWAMKEQSESELNDRGILQARPFAELRRVLNVQDMGRPFIPFLGRGPELINILRAKHRGCKGFRKNETRVYGLVIENVAWR